MWKQARPAPEGPHTQGESRTLARSESGAHRWLAWLLIAALVPLETTRGQVVDDGLPAPVEGEDLDGDDFGILDDGGEDDAGTGSFDDPEGGDLEGDPDGELDEVDEFGDGGEFDLDDELFLFEDIPIVVTAARRQQKITQSSVTIGLVTADDIFYGGHTSIPEMLQFSPGLDILYSDRNNVALGIRGLHHQFADRTLVLHDGRNATSAFFGGTDFFRLPIFPSDIERIEIVRGPGGAAWGANAFNGVINIISKKPKDILGVHAFAQVNEFGDIYNSFRWAEAADRVSWRISGGYETRETSDEALDSDVFTSNDFSQHWVLNGQAVFDPTDETSVDLGAALAHINRGDFEIAGFPGANDPRRDETIDVLRLHGRVDHEFESGNTSYLQWFTNLEDVDRPSIWTYQTVETDIETQTDLPLSDSNRLSIGGNVRWIHIDATRRRATDFADTEELSEFWAGLFAIDSWDLTDRIVLETQARADWYSQTRVDWSGRLSLICSLDEESRHSLRFGVAKAFRAPSHGLREIRSQRIPLPSPPLPPNSFGVNLTPSEDLDNEQTWYAEVGYTANLLQGLTLSATGYFQHYEDLIGFQLMPDPFGAGRILASLDNIDGGTGYGAEIELRYVTEHYSLTGWYAHAGFDTANSNQGIRAFQPARNKVGLTGRFFLPWDLTANAAYKYVSRTENDPGTTLFGAVAEFHRLDLSLSKKLAYERLEFSIGIKDIFDETSEAVTAVGAFTPAHETPGRTFFAQLRMQL